MNLPDRKPCGMRMSSLDGVVLLLAVAGAWQLHRMEHPLWWIVVVVVGHFFLFCNVFRVRRSLELWWAGLFLLNVTVCFLLGHVDWWPAMGIQLPVTVVVIGLEVRSPTYHGIGARWINRITAPSAQNLL